MEEDNISKDFQNSDFKHDDDDFSNNLPPEELQVTQYDSTNYNEPNVPPGNDSDNQSVDDTEPTKRIRHVPKKKEVKKRRRVNLKEKVGVVELSESTYVVGLMFLFSITNCVGLVLVFLLTLLNIVIGIIPWTFYIIEFITLVFHFISMVCFLGNITNNASYPRVSKLIYDPFDDDENINSGKTMSGTITQIIFTGICLLLSFLNCVLGILPWGFYLLEFIKLTVYIVYFVFAVKHFLYCKEIWTRNRMSVSGL